MVSGVHELGVAYRSGVMTPLDAVEQCLAAIEALDGQVGAWQSVYADEARAAAAAAGDALAQGQDLGPFLGIPFALKDIVDLEGRVATAGCYEYRDRISPATASIASSLLAAGGILVGKTKTVEFAMGGWGTNQHMGTPWNPWDAVTHRTPGGSSCGSGAAVGAGMVPCAVGTDTGGSVRLPAAFCGIVGLKTTEGLLPIDGIVPLSHTLDTPGPMTRSTIDAALMFEAMGGSAVTEADLAAGVQGLRLAAIGRRERDGVAEEQLAGFDNAVDLLRSLGAVVEEVDPPRPFDEMKDTTFVIVTAEAYYHHGALMDDLSARIDENVRGRIRPGAEITAAQYVAAALERQADQAVFADAMSGFDAYLTPTTPTLALPVEGVDEGTTPARFTRAGNYLALCGTAVPWGVAPSGLPGSLQVMCRGGDERLALRITAAFEAARGPLPQPPIWPA